MYKTNNNIENEMVDSGDSTNMYMEKKVI
jgi:hypothetical protein